MVSEDGQDVWGRGWLEMTGTMMVGNRVVREKATRINWETEVFVL